MAPPADLSALIFQRRVVRTGGADDVIPSSSTAAAEMDFCFVCISVLNVLFWKSCVSYLTANVVSDKEDL